MSTIWVFQCISLQQLPLGPPLLNHFGWLSVVNGNHWCSCLFRNPFARHFYPFHSISSRLADVLRQRGRDEYSNSEIPNNRSSESGKKGGGEKTKQQHGNHTTGRTDRPPAQRSGRCGKCSPPPPPVNATIPQWHRPLPSPTAFLPAALLRV